VTQNCLGVLSLDWT